MLYRRARLPWCSVGSSAAARHACLCTVAPAPVHEPQISACNQISLRYRVSSDRGASHSFRFPWGLSALSSMCKSCDGQPCDDIALTCITGPLKLCAQVSGIQCDSGMHVHCALHGQCTPHTTPCKLHRMQAHTRMQAAQRVIHTHREWPEYSTCINESGAGGFHAEGDEPRPPGLTPVPAHSPRCTSASSLVTRMPVCIWREREREICHDPEHCYGRACLLPSLLLLVTVRASGSGRFLRASSCSNAAGTQDADSKQNTVNIILCHVAHSLAQGEGVDGGPQDVQQLPPHHQAHAQSLALGCSCLQLPQVLCACPRCRAGWICILLCTPHATT